MKQLLLVALLLPFFSIGQTRSITGTVTDENKQPLPGATVQIQGTQGIGSITDFDGNFSIQLTQDTQNTIVISYLGYLEEIVDISSTNEVSVSLAPDVTKLEEVIVVGYGTVLKKDLTGAVSSVKVEDNVARQSMSVDQLLEGRAAGVQVTGNLSNPNAGFSVKIRGTNSLRGNNEPLYVVDGIIMSSSGEDAALNLGGNDLQSNQNGLNGINPRDIERIEVLKDASATAIYGSRGANGVIIITTKQGEKGKVNY
jgi:TonB-dependent SusC/RagA subfamily outer membrane receptor